MIMQEKERKNVMKKCMIIFAIVLMALGFIVEVNPDILLVLAAIGVVLAFLFLILFLIMHTIWEVTGKMPEIELPSIRKNQESEGK